MHRSTPRPRPVPGAIVGYVAGRPVHVIAGGSGEDDPNPNPTPNPAAPAPTPTPKDVLERKTPEGEGGEDEETVTVTQKRMNLLLTREKDQGRQAALRALASEAGLDPESVDATALKQVLLDAKKLKDAQLSDEQRREAEFTQREQAIAAREAAAEKAAAAADARLQEAARSSQLVSLGATGQDLEDALLLLNKALDGDPDADEAAVSKAADALKKRRPLLFGVPGEPLKPAAPPAPSGSPAGGPPQRQTPAGKPGDAGRAMAARMFPADDAA
ncbi:hypothetical protein [Streptomyces sp. H27-C3]|uniref:hypothetical protein n=1 Tax=Streptomyces sp. H27-C3 TaxID=3046305 RepID=UPI0024B97471|nr:hypothetical protein [Streptomyces sp. H27-C3]MDJ0464995.1 hypothetical protein [Streptomyces sp. H27-C3]